MNIFKLIAVSFFLSLNANAISLVFDFRVNSSGPAIYACNAGIKHQVDAVQCYLQDDRTTPCDLGAGSDHLCECEGPNGGTFLPEAAIASHVDFGQDPGSTTPTVSVKRSVNTVAFNQVFTDTDAWTKHLVDLTYNFGSESYGSSYFVDICFRGSKIDTTSNGGIPAPTLLEAKVIAENLVGSGYTAAAEVEAAAEYVCDLQGEGTYTAPAGPNDLVNEAIFGAGDVSDSTDFVDVLGQGLTFFSLIVNDSDNTHYPRFCKVRYTFQETADARRENDLQSAQFKTYTRLEDTL